MTQATNRGAIEAGQHYPLGRLLPGSVHSVSCSLPTMADVIGYEEKRPETLAQISSGYPRFVPHPLVNGLADRLSSGEGLTAVVPNAWVAQSLARFCNADWDNVKARELPTGALAVHLPLGSDQETTVRKFLQHTGHCISSREAEDNLLALGHLDRRQEETRFEGEDPEAVIRAQWLGLAGYDAASVHTTLVQTGMSAFYAAFESINAIQRPRGRNVWIQLGWLYLDTAEILGKWSTAADRPQRFYDATNLEVLEAYLKAHGDRVAGLVTEAPTNPLLTTPDLERLRALADSYGFHLVVDPTLATPMNVDVLPWCDVLVNSLTKYTASEGDVLAGIAAVNASRPDAEALHAGIREFSVPFYEADARRLAAQIGKTREVTERINANSAQLVAFLEEHPAIDTLWHPNAADTSEAFEAIRRPAGGLGGVFSFSVKGLLANFYDRVALPKGPSFGLDFSLMCPFMYLAHYDLVSQSEGREFLSNQGLEPELIRFSVGTENAAQLCELLDRALQV